MIGKQAIRGRRGARCLVAFGLIACSEPVAGTPRVTIIAPADADTVCGEPLIIELLVEDFVLVPVDGTDVQPGTGHVDLSLNGQAVSMSDATTQALPDIADGLYQVQAELVYADHTSLVPYAGHTIFATVDNRRCPESR